MKKVYIDSDVILDLLQKRKGFFDDAARLFTLLEKGTVRGYVSPLVLANLYYILRKDNGQKAALESLLRLRMLVKVLAIDEKTTDLALSSAFKDFEDAMQYYSAVGNSLDCLITRNKKDYKAADIPVYSPREFLDILEG